MKRIMPGVALFVCMSLAHAVEAPVANGNFEAGASADGVPLHWDHWRPAAGPVISIVKDRKQEGAGAVHIVTESDQIAYLMSEPIPVAPGEKLTLSAWCRTEGLSSSSDGTIGLAAGWMDQFKVYSPVAEYTTYPLDRSGEWFRMTCEAEAPPDAAYFTLQLRHRAVTGKTWWDDARVETSSPVVLRFALQMPTMEPGASMADAILINRNTADSGKKIKLRSDPGNMNQEVELPGELETTITVPFRIEKRGAQELSAELRDSSGGKLFSATAKVKVPPPLVMEPILPVYSCMEDSSPTIEARIWVHEPEETRSRARLECTIRRAAGGEGDKPIASKVIDAPQIENRITVDVGSLKSLGKGDYVVQARILHGSKVLSSGTQDWHIISRAQAQVSFGKDGFLLADGKKYFPMGLFDGSRFAELAEAGLNVTQNFDVGHVRRGYLPDNVRMKKILDDSHALGMKHLFLVVHGRGSRILDDEAIRRLLMFRNHPGVLTWYEEEGVARGDVPLTFLKELHETVKTLAPEHPLVVGDTRDEIGKMDDRSNFFPVEYMDAGIWWWYPFPIRKGGRPGAYEGEEIGAGLELVPPSFLTLAKTDKPIWVVLQSYKKERGRFPTKAEYRAQPYIAVIHGAKGLFWYTGSYRGGIQGAPEEGNYEYYKQLVGELREMAPVFMSPDADRQPKLTPGNDLLSFRLKDVGDRNILLAVNRNDRPAEVTFDVPGLKAGEIRVRYENRVVLAKDGKLTDNFDVYAAHVYEFPK